MTHATVDGLSISYEVIGEGPPWAITPGGRFSKDFPGVRELAEGLAAEGNQVLIYDRPNCGASDVCFTGSSESAMQADTLAALLRHLDMTPAVIAGGSGGARVSMLTAARHPDVAAGLAVWWISGGAFGLMSLGMHYCGQNLVKAWEDGMEAVVALPEWEEVLSRNPSNRQRILEQDRREFIATMERWMLAYCPCGDEELVPGLARADARALDLPSLVFRSGESDAYHTRATSEAVADALPNAQLVEPPWVDREWIERSADHQVNGKLFDRWPLLAPQLVEWSREVLK
jgi:pimeloyl-ACP methyl ester carboxylesterase